MDEATNGVARAPKNWNAPETQEALANEARVIMVESAYLRRQLPAETPAEVRAGIDEYLGASVDMEDATAHRKGTARDAAIIEQMRRKTKLQRRAIKDIGGEASSGRCARGQHRWQHGRDSRYGAAESGAVRRGS